MAGDGGTSIVLHTVPTTAAFVTRGKFGGALDFNDVQHYAWFQDPTFDVGTKGTLSFWVQMDDTSRRNELFEGPNNAGFEMQYRTNRQRPILTAVRRRSAATSSFATRTTPTRRAYGPNLQYTWDFATKQMHIYRDGVESAYVSVRPRLTSLGAPSSARLTA